MLPLLLLMQPTRVWQPPLHPSSQRYSSCETTLLGEKNYFLSLSAHIFLRAGRPRHRLAKKIFLTPWHLLLSSQPVTRTMEKEFLPNFSVCPQDIELKTYHQQGLAQSSWPIHITERWIFVWVLTKSQNLLSSFSILFATASLMNWCSGSSEQQ